MTLGAKGKELRTRWVELATVTVPARHRLGWVQASTCPRPWHRTLRPRRHQDILRHCPTRMLRRTRHLATWLRELRILIRLSHPCSTICLSEASLLSSPSCSQLRYNRLCRSYVWHFIFLRISAADSPVSLAFFYTNALVWWLDSEDSLAGWEDDVLSLPPFPFLSAPFLEPLSFCIYSHWKKIVPPGY